MKDLIFISYRREDASTFASILHAELGKHFLTNSIFHDYNNLQPGSDFKEEINKAVADSSVLLILISKNWLQINESGISRLFSDNDFVKHEILSALNKGIVIIPVLFENAKLPLREELPEDLRSLCDRQVFVIHPQTALDDIRALVEVIKSNRKFKYDKATFFGEYERLFKSPLTSIKETLKDVSEIYSKDFTALKNLFKKNK
jgi:hypothetical protein